MGNLKKSLFAFVLIIIVLTLLLFLPSGKQSLDNDTHEDGISPSAANESCSELRLNEKDCERILAFYLTSYESKLPRTTSIRDYALSFDNSMICINIKVQKDNILTDIPINLHLEFSPSSRDNSICMELNKAQIAGITVSSSMAADLLASLVSKVPVISFNGSQILIDLGEYPFQIISIGFDNQDLLIKFSLKL